MDTDSSDEGAAPGKQRKWPMTTRQSGIAAEALAASLLSRAGYDVLVQYGPHQPDYDLVAVKGEQLLPVSVKGTQDGGWMLATPKPAHLTPHQAIEEWRQKQRRDAVFVLVSFYHVPVSAAPRVYIATTDEVADAMKAQHDGQGFCALQENSSQTAVRPKYPGDKLSEHWRFTGERMAEIAKVIALAPRESLRRLSEDRSLSMNARGVEDVASPP